MCECATWYDAILENFPAHQQRLVIEYKELANRAEKLCANLTKYDAEKLDQLSIICARMSILEERAEIEGVDLSILAGPEGNSSEKSNS